jgi:hypothetical protein
VLLLRLRLHVHGVRLRLHVLHLHLHLLELHLLVLELVRVLKLMLKLMRRYARCRHQVGRGCRMLQLTVTYNHT